MAENPPPSVKPDTWYNKSRERYTKNNCVKKISGIVGSQCSYTLGTTSSFTIGASSSVTVGAALSVTIGGKLSFTSAMSFEFAASRTMTITRGTAMTMVYADSYAYQKGAKYAVEAHSSNDFKPIRWDFTGNVKKEVDKVKDSISKSETKTVTEKYTINAQAHELNIDSTETKSVIGSSSEAVQGIKTITSQGTLNLAGALSVNIGTASTFIKLNSSGIFQSGAADFGNPSPSPLADLLTAAQSQIQSAELALETAEIRAAAVQSAVAQVQVVANTVAANPVPLVTSP